jgi:hypothetical protein
MSVLSIRNTATESLHLAEVLRVCLACQSHENSLQHEHLSETDTRVQLLNPLMVEAHLKDI